MNTFVVGYIIVLFAMWSECFHFLGICLFSHTTNNVENSFFKWSHGFLRFKIYNAARVSSIKKKPGVVNISIQGKVLVMNPHH